MPLIVLIFGLNFNSMILTVAAQWGHSRLLRYFIIALGNLAFRQFATGMPIPIALRLVR